MASDRAKASFQNSSPCASKSGSLPDWVEHFPRLKWLVPPSLNLPSSFLYVQLDSWKWTPVLPPFGLWCSLHSHIVLWDPPHGVTTLPLIFQILRRNPHYSQTPNLWMCLLPWEITPPAPSIYSGYFPSHPPRHTQSKDPTHLDRVHQRVPSGHQSRWRSTSLFQLILSTSVLLTIYLVPYFPHLCAFGDFAF